MRVFTSEKTWIRCLPASHLSLVAHAWRARSPSSLHDGHGDACRWNVDRTRDAAAATAAASYTDRSAVMDRGKNDNDDVGLLVVGRCGAVPEQMYAASVDDTRSDGSRCWRDGWGGESRDGRRVLGTTTQMKSHAQKLSVSSAGRSTC